MKRLNDVVEALPKLKLALSRACQWLVNVSLVRTDQLTAERNSHQFPYDNWRGAFRGEYSAATRTWDFFCPIWHGGQAVKALVLAHRVLPEQDLLAPAMEGAGFILRHQVKSGPDAGLILAYEDLPDQVFTSAILESLDGLFHLGRVTEDRRYTDAALAAAKWCRDRAWIADQGLIRDLYDPKTGRFVENAVVVKDGAPGRPLADDAIWLIAHQLTGEAAYRHAFYDVLNRLLVDERPSGNWVDYGPCRPEFGECHPRHAYWWGLPMINAWRDSRDPRWLDGARRAGLWYIKAQRTDGGLFRYTDLEFKTGCFDHATSGIMCASILWLRLFQETGDPMWLEPMHRALNYAINLQFVTPADPNLKGCILEKVLAPDGTDRSPYYIRDLGTIFFAQATAMLLSAVSWPAVEVSATVSIGPRKKRYVFQPGNE